nr:ATP-binding protein [Thermococcus sp. Bubb.Bath]
MGSEFAGIITHLYDYSELRIVVTSSEVGLLHDYLGVNDPNAPLYGRYFHEIKLNRFTPEQSGEVLIKGFKQVGISPPEGIIENAVSKLDGIVGWLGILGERRLKEGSRGILWMKS